MAEYMDYNDYGDEPKSRGAKIRRKISLILSGAWLIALVLWVIISSATHDVFRSKYTPKSTRFYNIGEEVTGNNPFYSFYTELSKKDLSKKDLKSYPKIYNWFTTSPKMFPSNSYPLKEDGGGYLAIYLPYVIEGNIPTGKFDALSKGYIGLDVVLIQFDSDKSGDITLGNLIRFSAKYNCETGITTFVSANQDGFRLNFYNIGIEFDKPTEVEYSLSLTQGLTNKESKNQSVQKNIFLNQENADTVSGGEPNETKVVCSFKNKDTKFKINFDDMMYDKFAQITVRAKNATKYKVVINGED